MKFFSIALIASAILAVTLAKPTSFSDEFSLMKDDGEEIKLTPTEAIKAMKCQSIHLDELSKAYKFEDLWKIAAPKYNAGIEKAEKCSKDNKDDGDIDTCILTRLMEAQPALTNLAEAIKERLDTKSFEAVTEELLSCAKDAKSGSSLPMAAGGACLFGIYLFIQLLAHVRN